MDKVTEVTSKVAITAVLQKPEFEQPNGKRKFCLPTA